MAAWGGAAVERPVRPSSVVGLLLGRDEAPRVREREEPALVQAFVAYPAVKRPDEGVVDRLPWTIEVQSRARAVHPRVERRALELGP